MLHGTCYCNGFHRRGLPSVGIAVLAFASGNGGRQLWGVHYVRRVDADARESPWNDFHLVGSAFSLLRRRGERLGAFRVHSRGAAVVEHEADDEPANEDARQHRQHYDDGQIGCFDVQRLR